jgi:ribosomal protection tetracycline resistance protein
VARGALNLGIVAHVDAGKTTLTERLLYAAGVIDEVGSVDDGTTQTDSLALERQRGITIKSAVVSFTVGDVTVNLIDTPGHPDFIAEVERALGVLDGAVLVISAVEGVQPQTRILMRALQRLRVPAVLFVNKIDRPGAGYERLLRDITERLTPAAVAMGGVRDLGTRAAGFARRDGADEGFTARLTEVLAERDQGIMAAYVRGEPRVPYRRLRAELAAQSRHGHVHPVFFGSALTGAGVDALMDGMAELLPAAGRNAAGPVSGRVFKIERGPAGEKVGALRSALAQLAEQDPLINVRQDDLRQEISVSLFGEVQKEVIGATLAADFGLAVSFRESTTICIERLAGTGAAVERLREPPNPFLATVGLRVSPAAAGSGVRFLIEVELGSMPAAFFRAVEDTVRETLRQGLHGWAVPDCTVAMTHSGYLGKHSLGHQRFNKSMSSTGEDYRKLTPLVLTNALRQAGTVVCEPVHRFRLDAPADTLGPLLAALTRLRAVPLVQVSSSAALVLEGDVPAARVHELRTELPVLTRGEGVLECTFDRYEPAKVKG